jgi:hypothetical protein
MGRHPEHHALHTTLSETTPQGAPLCDTTPSRGGCVTKRLSVPGSLPQVASYPQPSSRITQDTVSET